MILFVADSNCELHQQAVEDMDMRLVKNRDLIAVRDGNNPLIRRHARRLLVAGVFMAWASLGGINSLKAADDILATDLAARIETLIQSELKSWTYDPFMLAAVRAQNSRHAALTQSEIERLDQQWKVETRQGSRPLINEVMSRSSSHLLKSLQSKAKGLITEVILMDYKGLNVGLSDVTSDYWQGDEAKWQRIVPEGPDAWFVDRVEWDESTQQFQCQVSLPIVADHTVVGAITFGINVDQLVSDPNYDRSATMPIAH